MRYDEGTITDCDAGGILACGENQIIGWTTNSNYVGLPTIREMQQMTGAVGVTGIDSPNTWSVADSSDSLYWLLSPYWRSTISFYYPGAWVSVFSGTGYPTNINPGFIDVRPVINLAEGNLIIQGDGSENNPFVLK